MAILITGGAGFIGANFIHQWLETATEQIVCIDKLTYAGNRANLADVEHRDTFEFVQCGIEDTEAVVTLFSKHNFRAVVNFAAESHVDRSIIGPEAFVQTNVVGTSRLLQVAKQHWDLAPESEKQHFRFLHVSTDEVYGTLLAGDPAFTEETPYRPNSPYAASKAASDHFVRAFGETYGLPVLITHCSNNYGRYHFPEKLIPLVINNALQEKELPLYGDGQQVRDWLFVEDHCTAIRRVLEAGVPGETYNIGGNNEKTNLDVVRTICTILDNARPRPNGRSYLDLITFVKDRPGHDRRYAVNAEKIRRELGWSPAETFDTGIEKTVNWYLDNQEWVENVTSGAYRNWIAAQYA